ncbi:hypothetical protein KDA23_01700 [Candidatus Saccharibacteria bacterium]|nr:hypothetical protein [Candidatus Saccharibacteria bacterium]
MSEHKKPQITVGGDSKQFFRGLSEGTRKVVLLILLALACVAVGYAFYYFLIRSDNASVVDDGTYRLSNQEYAQALQKDLRKKTPSTGSSVAEQRQYYDNLIATDYQAKDYKAVIADYTTFVTATNDADLTYNAYVAVAKTYSMQGDATAAVQTVDRATTAIKNTTTDKDMETSFLDSLAELRKEVSQ